MRVRTPGTTPRYAGMSPVPREPCLAIVLDYSAHAEGEPRMTGGQYVDVLRTSDWREISGVLLSGQQGRGKVDNLLIETTDPDLVVRVRSATHGGGTRVSELVGQSELWGSLVLVEWLSGGIAYTRTVFPHAYHPASLSPVTSLSLVDADVAAGAAGNAVATGDVSVPDRAPPRRSPPVAFARHADVWTEGYTGAWLNAYYVAYETGTAVNVDLKDNADKTEQAGIDGARTGFREGSAEGLRARAAASVPTPVDTAVDWTEPDTATEADTAKGAMVAARTTGADKVISNGGVRLILRADGVAILDAQDGSRIRIQSNGTGTRISAMDGAGGSIDVDVRQGGVYLGSTGATKRVVLWEDLQPWLTSVQAAYMLHTHNTSVSVPSLPVEIFDPPGDYGATKVFGV